MTPLEDPVVLIRILVGFTLTTLLILACKKFLNKLPVLAPANLDVPGRKLWSYSLSPRHTIYLVEVFGKVYLIGTSPEKIEVLDRIENPEADTYLAQLDEKLETSSPPFLLNLNKFIQR